MENDDPSIVHRFPVAEFYSSSTSTFIHSSPLFKPPTKLNSRGRSWQAASFWPPKESYKGMKNRA